MHSWVLAGIDQGEDPERWVFLHDGVTTRTATTFDVDHLIPLEEAWTSGACTWTTARRTNHANDLNYPFSL